MEDKDFLSLSPHRKVLYYEIQSLYNYFNGDKNGLKKADRWLAIATHQGKDTVRRARKLFKAYGWIDYRPGYQTTIHGDRGVPTSYEQVRWGCPGTSFVQMDRLSFEVVLHYLRLGDIKHADVTVYVALAYWQKTHEGSGAAGDFFIRKGRLRQLTGVQDVAASLKRLSEIEQGYFFNYEETHRQFLVDGFSYITSQDYKGAIEGIHKSIDKEYRSQILSGTKP